MAVSWTFSRAAFLMLAAVTGAAATNNVSTGTITIVENIPSDLNLTRP